jgi:hypothetical protein
MTVGESTNQKLEYDVTDQLKRRLEARHEDLKKKTARGKGHPRGDVEIDISKISP